MRTRGRKRAWLAAWAIGSGSGGWLKKSAGTGTGLGLVGVGAQSTAAAVGRWGQASALLSPNDTPTLLVVSGKTYVAGQTVTSTPSTSSALSLDLSSPISDLSSPPWLDLSSSGPISSYGSLIPLSSASAVFFGGDATGDADFAVQTGNDSSWTLSLSSSSTSSLFSTWTYESPTLWPLQPQRRELAYSASATNGTLSRAWIYGGERADGSGSAYSDLWELQLPVAQDVLETTSAHWVAWSGTSGPPAMFDGSAVLVSSTTSGALPSVYFIGGVQIEAGTSSLVALDSVYVFTPTDALGGGSWEVVSMSGTTPAGRRGHVAVDIGDGKIWVQGGRSLDGETVLSDAAILDTRKQTWSTAEKGGQVWGSSVAMVGETVVMAFGYGANSAASTALSVYCPANDTWLDAYYPSYIAAVVSNPKAGGSSSSSSSTSAASWYQATTTDAVTSSATSTATSPSASSSSGSSSSSNASSSSASSTDGSDSTSNSGDSSSSSNGSSSPDWTSPGAAGTTTPSSSDPSGSNSSDDGGSSGSSKSVIAGAVVGSILGALALFAGGAFAVRRYRDSHAYAGAGFTGDEEGGGGGGRGGLMAEQRFGGGYAGSEMYNLGKALPVNPVSGSIGRVAGAGAGVGVFSTIAGFLSPRERYASTGGAGGRRRFGILDDEEESDVWDASMGRKETGWQQFADHDEKQDDFSAPSLAGRGGVGIWDGFSSTASDTLKSSTSYLGGALGGFIGLANGDTTNGASRQRDEEKDDLDQDHRYASVVRSHQQAYADPSLTPIVEWEEDDEDAETHSQPDDSRTLDSHQTHSSGTHNTGSTYPTSTEASPTKALPLVRSALTSSISRPFSPAASLYGSGFNAPQPIVAAAVAASSSSDQAQPLSRASSAASSVMHTPGFLPRSSNTNASWWSRLNKSHGGEIPTPTASQGIRDPAPVPSFSLPNVAGIDPFADDSTPVRSSSQNTSRKLSTRSTRPDEHGRFPSSGGGLGHLQRGEHDLSVSSTASSDVTATSSVMEERLRHMDVVQRIRTGSGGMDGDTSSCDVTPTLGTTEDGARFGQLPESHNPFADSPVTESVVWAGSTAGAFSDIGRSSIPPPVPPLPISVAIQPPTPSYAPPTSPRKGRLLGPRPLPPLSPSTTSPFSASTFSPSPIALALPTRSNSVRDLVAKFDGGGGGGSENLPVPTLASPPKRKAVRKVEHGFAKKPQLYIANPDD